MPLDTNQGCHVEAAWLEICNNTVPDGACPEQVDDMRMMFFCGAVCLYDMIAKLLQDKPNSGSAAFMQAIHLELSAFMAEKVDGRLDS